MNNTLHTPGPWYLDAHDEKGWFLLSENGPDIMAEPFDCSDSDARLIASSPDLLQVVEDYVLLCDLHDYVGAVPDAARAALRKAKGEA